jgi:hypothetical protein
VGMGTNSPSTLLHVYKDADVWHTFIGGNTGVLAIGGQTANGAVIEAFNPSNGAARDLYLQRDGGNTGIGTSYPQAPLHIASAGTTAIPNMLLEQTNSDFARLTFKNSIGTSFTLAAVTNATLTNGDQFNFYSNSLGANLLSISANPQNNISLNGSLAVKTEYDADYLNPPYPSFTLTGGVDNDVPITNTIYFDLFNAIGGLGSNTQITGLAGGVDGRIIILCNSAGDDIVLKNNDTRSAAGNRFNFPGGDITLRGLQHGATPLYTINGRTSLVLMYLVPPGGTTGFWTSIGGGW